MAADASAPRHVVYNHTVKGFLTHVLERRGLLKPDLVKALAALGVDVKRPADVPIADWWKVLALGRRAVATPDLSDEAAYELLGGEVVHGFERTFVGGSAFLVLRMLGPRRALKQLTAQYRTADSVTQVESRELSPTHVELDFTVVGGVPWPTYMKGVLLEGMRLVGARDAAVAVEQAPGCDCRLVVTWHA